VAAGRLVPRDVVVYVPEGAGPWPALYAHDGQNLFNPGAPFGGWQFPDAVAEVGPTLVVGIANTQDRLAEYSHVDDVIGGNRVTSVGDEYVKLVDEVVRPAIEARYPTSGVNGIVGSSMGGLASLHVAADRPGRWDVVLSLSGTLGWGRFGLNEASMHDLWAGPPRTDTVVYVDSGGGPGDRGCEDLDQDGLGEDDPDGTDNYCTNRAFADGLAARGWVWGDNLHHWHEPGAGHNEAAWAARLARPLSYLHR
jgi:hypothetical protein